MTLGLNKGLGRALISLTWNPEYLATHQGGELLLFASFDIVTFEEGPEESKGGALQMSCERAHQAEGPGGAKALRLECP